jgi:hypothetical protein
MWDVAHWRVVWRALPDPVGLAVWLIATVTAPMLVFEWSHRWEEDQPISSALWWTVGAVPVLAAVVASRCGSGGRRGTASFMAAVATATLISTVFLGVSVAVYRWVIPLSGAAPWRSVLVTGVLLAASGAVLGYLVGPRRARRTSPTGWRGYLFGAMIAVAGALLAQTTIRLGAEGSAVEPDLRTYGGVGPYTSSPSGPGVLTLPMAGRYAIWQMGSPLDDPDCRIDGSGLANRPAEPVTIPPGNFGGDYASYSWVAFFDVPAPGTFSLTCRTSNEQASYLVGEVPRIRGVVGALIHWPLTVIWLLAAIPGLLRIADAIRGRSRPADDPDRPVTYGL